MTRLTDRVVIITGASSGIGRALAWELAGRGCKLVLAARNQERLAAVAERCEQLGAAALVVPTDVTVEAECQRLIARTIERFGRLDILVNNAGRAMWSRFDELADLSVMEDVMRLNYFAALSCTRYALPHLKQSRGQIVAVASAAGLISPPMLSGYAASKHALIGFCESLRIELADSGVSVTIAAPDFVQTEILDRAIGSDGRPLDTSPLDQRTLMTAEKCARRIARAIARRQRLLLTSHRSAWGRWGLIICPWLVDWISGWVVGTKQK